MEGEQSRINNTTDSVVDRFSALPDSILGHILSFLPTKAAVATSVLSNRWKFAWVSVHNLDFCYPRYKFEPDGPDGADNMKFVRFVDKVMLLHDGGSINKFSLDWYACAISSHVRSWINIAITRNVHELYLSLGLGLGLGDGEIFDIPISGFNCDSLQSLQFSKISLVCDGTAVCLPRLKILILDHVYFESKEACEKLISGCPMLQYLYTDIYCLDDGQVEKLDIPLSVLSCDSLQRLKLKENIYVPAAIVVCLPRLEQLMLDNVTFESKEACEKLINGCPMLQYLYMAIYWGDGQVEELDIPLSVLRCDSLRCLELKGGIYVPAAIVVCLPRLEKLMLDDVKFESTEACVKLINGCPMLQYLYLYVDYFLIDNGDDHNDHFTCIISSASLRHLEIHFMKYSSLKLKASSLESLKVSGCISDISVEKGLNSLVQADININLDGHDFPNNSIVEAVRTFDCAEVLNLSSDVMLALSRATISLSTEFKRLVKLEAGTYCSSLQDVIQSSDNLESLTIDQIDQISFNVHGHSKWTTPVEVPRCLSNNLKNVQLIDYKGLKDEREMIRYMLKHGSVLEVMQIICYTNGDGEKLKMLREISEFPRKSPVCKVQFIG